MTVIAADVVCTVHIDPDWLEVKQAPPRALFAGVLLRDHRSWPGRSYASIIRPPEHETDGCVPTCVTVGDVLRITHGRANDQILIYRLVEWDPATDTFTGEWPD